MGCTVYGRHTHSSGDSPQYFLANSDATPADTKHLHWPSGEGASVSAPGEEASFPARPVSYDGASSEPSDKSQEASSSFSFPFGFLPQVQRARERDAESEKKRARESERASENARARERGRYSIHIIHIID